MWLCPNHQIGGLVVHFQIETLSSAQVDAHLRELYGLYGSIPDADYEAREAALRARQAELKAFAAGAAAPGLFSGMALPEHPVPAGAGRRSGTIFPKKPYVPIKDSLIRRKRFERLAATAYVPDAVKACFTAGQLACIVVYLSEWKRQGFCDVSNKEVCDRSGVTDPVRRQALKTAIAEGLLLKTERPVKGAKHKTNVVTLNEASEIGALVKKWMRDGYRLRQVEKRLMLIGVRTVRPLDNFLVMKSLSKARSELRRASRKPSCMLRMGFRDEGRVHPPLDSEKAVIR